MPLEKDASIEVAALTVKVEMLERDISELKSDVKQLLAVVNQTRGGWKTIVLVSGVAGTVGAVLAKLVPLFGIMPK